MKYANDLLLTELARRITNDWAEINALLTAGELGRAFEKALVMDTNLEGFMCQLGDIKEQRS